MAGRTPYEATLEYLESHQRMLSPVTNQVMQNFGGYHPAERPHRMYLGRGEPVRMGIRSQFGLSLKQYYRLAALTSVESHARWTVVLTSYFYEFTSLDGQAILSYHWHPDSGQRASHPHLHLDAGARVGRVELQRAHFPTNLISVADIVRFAIEELGVEPRRHDWEAMLVQAESAE